MSKFNDFESICGKILNGSLSLENCLEFVISNFFVNYSEYEKKSLFNDLMITELNFCKKKEIFKSICNNFLLNKSLLYNIKELSKTEKLEDSKVKKELKEVFDAIEYVLSIRNAIAHKERYFDGYMIKLQSKKSIKNKKDEIEITPFLIKNFENKRLFAVNKIHELFNKIEEKEKEIKKKITEW